MQRTNVLTLELNRYRQQTMDGGRRMTTTMTTHFKSLLLYEIRNQLPRQTFWNSRKNTVHNLQYNNLTTFQHFTFNDQDATLCFFSAGFFDSKSKGVDSTTHIELSARAEGRTRTLCTNFSLADSLILTGIQFSILLLSKLKN